MLEVRRAVVNKGIPVGDLPFELSHALLAFLHDTVVERLNGPHVVWIKLGERADFLSGDLHRSLQHEPCDAFCAGRSGLRSLVRVISRVVRQQPRGINFQSGNLVLFARGLRHILPKLLNDGIRVTRLQKNCDGGNFSVATCVHQVSHHLVRLTVNLLFAGTVKVELRQLKALGSDDQKIPIARPVVQPDRSVSVVDDCNRSTFVFESYGGKVRCLGISNVDRRLLLAGSARGIVRIEVAPMFRPVSSCVTPFRFPLRSWTRRNENHCSNQQRKRYQAFSQIAPRFALTE